MQIDTAEEKRRIDLVAEKLSKHFVHVDAAGAPESFTTGSALFDVSENGARLKRFFSERPALAALRRAGTHGDHSSAGFNQERFVVHYAVHRDYDSLNLGTLLSGEGGAQ
jgi:hypothetical protein